MDFRRSSLIMLAVLGTLILASVPGDVWAANPPSTAARSLRPYLKARIEQLPIAERREFVERLQRKFDPYGTYSDTSDIARITAMLKRGKVSLEQIRKLLEEETRQLQRLRFRTHIRDQFAPPGHTNSYRRPRTGTSKKTSIDNLSLVKHYETYWMQLALNRFNGIGMDDSGYLEPNGARGPETQAALDRYKWSKGLVPDGKLGASTRVLLAKDSGIPSPPLPPYLHRLAPPQQDAVKVEPQENLNGVVLNVSESGVQVWEPGKRDPSSLSSAEELRVVTHGRTVLHAGDDLPVGWARGMESIRTIRVSPASKKEFVSDHLSVAAKLDSPVVPGTLRVLSALPKLDLSASEGEARKELSKMNLKPYEEAEWKRFGLAMEKFSSMVELLTKETLFDELRAGGSDLLVVAVHKVEDRFHLPGGETFTIEEIQKLPDRNDVPRRLVMFVACHGSGELADILVEKGLAGGVVSRSDEVSAWRLLDVLRDVQEQKTLGEAFREFDFRTQLHEWLERYLVAHSSNRLLMPDA